MWNVIAETRDASRYRVRGMAYVAVLALAACAGPRAGAGTRPSPSRVAQAPEAPIPSAPSAVLYATAVETSRTQDALGNRLAEEADRFRKKLGQTVLVRDGRLDRAAYDIALLSNRVGVPPSASVAFLLFHYGVVEPEPNLILIKGGDGAEDSAVKDLRHQLSGIQGAGSWRRLGIGVYRHDAEWVAVLAFAEHHLELEPVSRMLPPQGEAAVSGRVLGAYREPEVLVTSPRGTVRRLAASVQHSTFRARLDCNLGDGAYQVEINAADERGPTVLANFPVYCGVAPPQRLPEQASVLAGSVSPAMVETQLLDLMDRDRAAHGLPALIRDPRLAQVARRYSAEMAETGEVAHLSRRSGSVVDRVRKADITPTPTVVAENVGRDYSAADAELGFMSSPGHRDNILSRAVTHVGVGVVAGRAEGGMVPLFFTQVFAGWGQ